MAISTLLAWSLAAMSLVIGNNLLRLSESHKLTESVAEWASSGEFMQFNGHAIFFVDKPSCSKSVVPTLLLIHGFPTSSFDWIPVRNELTKWFRVVCVDSLGFGLSDKPRHHTYSIGEQADIHVAVLRRLGVTSFHAMAHDYGDTVAQEILARYNGGSLGMQLKSLVLLNGGLFPEAHKPLLIQSALLNPYMGPVLMAILPGPALQKATARSFSRIFGPNTQPSHEEMDNYWCLIAHKNGHRVTDRTITYMADRVLHQNRWTAALVESRVKLLFINGVLDPISGAHMADRFAELVPDGMVVRLPDIGHYPQVEAPDRVIKALLDFHRK